MHPLADLVRKVCWYIFKESRPTHSEKIKIEYEKSHKIADFHWKQVKWLE